MKKRQLLYILEMAGPPMQISMSHTLQCVTDNLTYALKPSVNDGILSRIEVPSITPVVSIDPIMSQADT
jgi:hypothetical protein